MTKFITIKSFDRALSWNIFYADFETTVYNGQHYVTSISFINSKDSLYPITYCIKDFEQDYNLQKESKQVLEKFLAYFLQKDFNRSVIYFHNLGRFDKKPLV